VDSNRSRSVFQSIRALFGAGTAGGLSDGELLDRFTAGDGEGAELAFARLVERHGPMVLRVCRSVLRDVHDAEDAFQATFLILALKAGSVRRRDSLTAWLSSVAYNVAATARTSAARRREHEWKAGLARPLAVAEADHDDGGRAIHEELRRLPERYRSVLVLCCLEGLTQQQAAVQLGWPLGTVQSRLARGRRRLCARLARRGVTPAGAVPFPPSGPEATQAQVILPMALSSSTVRLALTIGAARDLAPGVAPVAVIRLVQREVGTMFVNKAGTTSIAAVLAAGMIAAGAALHAYQANPPGPADKVATKPQAAAVDGPDGLPTASGEAHKITVTTLQSKAVTITQSFVCQINSHHHIEVRAPQAGYLEAIPIREGQAVKRDDLLFRVRPLEHKEKPGAENEDKEIFIKAPFDGMVNRLPHQLGSLVQKNETLTTLFDNSLMWVYFNVPEKYYLEYMANRKQHEKEDKIQLVLANGNKYDRPGKLGAIGATFNNESGNIPFRADFPNPDGLLRHGQTGTLLISRVQDDAIVIPQRATFEILDKRYVYVVDKDDVAHRREFVIQDELEDLFVVKSGVGVGDKVVTEGVRRVRDGEKVEY
jgi:membrane fusion protein (multidrug efflux system)